MNLVGQHTSGNNSHWEELSELITSRTPVGENLGSVSALKVAVSTLPPHPKNMHFTSWSEGSPR